MRIRLTLRSIAFLALVATLLVGAAAALADSDLALVNPGFEQLEADGSVSAWHRDPGSGGPFELAPDDGQRHSGIGSLMLRAPDPVSAAVISEPVALQVGELYRLSGVIRTSDAFSDPSARYPTAVPACLSMASFPFTNHSPTVGADSYWTPVSTLFIATEPVDRVRLHLGYNGAATGTAWFDDIRLEKVASISEYVPPETVRWFADGYRFDDRGWIFLHVQGEPYQRGYQHGVLVADEIVDYIQKLSILENRDDPEAGWENVRLLTDALMLRGFDEEYLREMKGIADGAAHAGATNDDRPLDLLDIVAINSIIDLGQMRRGLTVTPHALTGQSFLAAEEEMLISDDELSCSAFAATAPATADGQVVFGQIFMWGGYTGVHWNVILDLEPTAGHRLVYQTFPGGIHSGADFYINQAGIVIGETTVSQTPFDATGTPQSNRIRRAAQYADSIDDVVRILRESNNGMYTNDWPIADIKTGEVAVFLLGTHADRLWRTGEDLAPFGTPGFLWANNNNRDPEVRKEYVAQPDDAPFDLMFSPWNRDLAFNRFYDEHKGEIDATAAVKLWASSPINRAHACDGKITTTDMASKLAFLAHYGKVTLREKFPEKGSRRMPDLPGAIPHLSLGYSVASPLVVTPKLLAARIPAPAEVPAASAEKRDLVELEAALSFNRRQLWGGTVYPASEAESWFVSGSAAYWDVLHDLPEDHAEAAEALADELAGLNCRYLYTVSREQDLAPVTTKRSYTSYGPYQIPRIKGTFALHQLHVLLGGERFVELMRGLHERFAGREVDTRTLVSAAEELARRPLTAFLAQWIERKGLPTLQPRARVQRRGGGWEVILEVTQPAPAYHLLTAVEIEAGGARHLRRVEVEGERTTIAFTLDERPTRLVFDPLNQVPVSNDRYYTFSNFIDDFHSTLIVYGTSRQIEANHTLALRWQTTLADAYVEILPPVVKDSEVGEADLASHDLMILGHPEDNALTARLAAALPASFAKNLFRWQGATYADPQDGLVMVVPNPFNPQRVLYLVIANSALELYHMTQRFERDLPSWAIFEGEDTVDRGYHRREDFVIELGDS